MIMKKKICLALSLLLAGSILNGCGGEVSNTVEEEIELVEPVGVTRDFAVADYRDLVSYKVLPGKVVPKTFEVTFSTAQRFEKYGALPGAEVTESSAILYASTEAIDEQIKNLKESMEDALEDYNEFLSEAKEDLAAAKWDEEYYGQIKKNFEALSEDERKGYPGMGFDAEYAKYSIMAADAAARKDRLEQNIKKRTELYDLDSAHDATKLKRLNSKRNNVLAIAGSKGKVVAINFYDEGQYIERNVPVAAIGDFSQLEVKCDQVYKSEVKKAADVYAMVNGRRFEVTYKEYNAEEQDSSQAATESNPGASSGQSYSTFIISDPEGIVKAGDFAAIVIVNQKKEDVLCVPKDAISSDQDGSFVYVLENEQTTYTAVKTGLSAGFYTEIVSGLSAGDKVVSELKVNQGSKTAALTTGKIATNYSESGYLFYSKREWITNPVEYGTTYIQSVDVKQYERVEKGQVIATVSVVPDSITIRRNERSLLRATEDLNKQLKDNEGKKETKQIKYQREYVQQLQEKIDEMKADAKVTEIKAPYNGIITSIYTFEEGDLLFYDSKIAQISAEEDCFVAVEDQAGQLSSGMETKISYKDASGVNREVTGNVVTVAPCALSKDLQTGYALISVSSEDLTSMAASNQGADGWWMRSRFNVKAEARSMDNVVLVPKSAVKIESGITYVVVLDENKNPVYKSFVSGGADNTYYWVAEGLSEGTIICLE